MIKKYNFIELGFYLFSFLTVSLILYNRQILLGLHYDDSFITYRYAINFSEGRGFVFYTGERINSASSLLYTLILSTFHFIGFKNLQVVSSLIGLLSGIGVIYLAYLFVCNFVSKILYRAYILIPFVFSGSIIAWATSGMETLFFMYLMLLFLKYYIKNNFIITTLLLCLLLICRAESVIILGTVLIVELFSAVNNKNYLTFFSFLIFGTFTITLYFLWNYLYFDSIIPHPVRFKNISRYYNPNIFDSLKEIFRFYFVKNSILTVLSIASILNLISNFIKSRTKFIDNKLLVTLSLYLLLSVGSFIVGPYSDFNRYMIHTIPIMAIMSAIFISHNYITIVKYKYIHISVLFISILILIRENRNISNYFYNSSIHQEKRIVVGKYINSKINHSDLIYSSDIGAISYFALNNHFVDLSGLTSLIPFYFIEKSQSVNYNEWLKSHKIVWVADTESNGKISSLEILKQPSNYFNTIRSDSNYSLNLYDISNKLILKESIGGDLNIVLMKLNKNLYLK